MSDPSPAVPAPVPSPAIARLQLVREILWRVLEAGFLLIGLVVLVYLLLGTGSGAFVQGVIANLGEVVSALTPQTVIGVAIVVAITNVLQRR